MMIIVMVITVMMIIMIVIIVMVEVAVKEVKFVAGDMMVGNILSSLHSFKGRVPQKTAGTTTYLVPGGGMVLSSSFCVRF